MAGEGRKIVKFFREVKAEMKKVTWPGRDTMITYTEIVLVVMVLFTIFIFLVDSVFSYILKLILKSF
ncbi:MAG: Preprotein translocase subunit SecE [Caldanaerobacter subterraneus]|jgi:preprotein translocase subunit SecE|uniref:Protein translocase subunit SecE n=2 Tax=Caldanaerobacter subterraneus TaxID=911092 RepID=A0A101E398_9THEO|nr:MULTISPECIES: preprotein translocase subunit SecE [Caldanaerobacter]ERM90970.1 preprotein translocase subunit SecE [Caldanaerobacter subterraneus subsp. yonseiensis KB-1]KUK08067.1 MAG: Preprotein translocase subunit SecE [Caldanaerobacter subterraneus]MBE3579973.1 preprotein translocase subunit SecE [Caldanaerobacter subterraneus]MDI3519606.1 preprotein translocase subunit SecE [Caldanaerobacter sp.]MDK2793602.1 preprotein translocase subunit SecE [Caldanaerobacter sp.]